jgi:hypothetical protein
MACCAAIMLLRHPPRPRFHSAEISYLNRNLTPLFTGGDEPLNTGGKQTRRPVQQHVRRTFREATLHLIALW